MNGVRLNKHTITLALASAVFLSLGVTGCGGPEAPKAGLKVEEGPVTLVRAGQETEHAKGATVPLQVGDTIRTGAKGDAVLIQGKNFVRVGPNSEVMFKTSMGASPDDPPMAVSLVKGVGQFLIEKSQTKHEGDKFLAVTHSVIAAVKGTAFQGKVDDSGAVSWTLTEGQIVLRDPDGSPLTVERAEGVPAPGGNAAAMAPGQTATIPGDGPATIGKAPDREYQAVKTRIFTTEALMANTIMNF